MSVTSGTLQQTELLGLSSNTLSVTFINTGVVAKFPISYGSTSSDPLSGNFTGFSFTGTCNGNVTTTADGLGTLNLPGGITLTNVLRVKSVQSINLVVGFLPLATAKQTIYNFYHSSQKFPVLSVNYTSIALTAQSPTVTGFVNGSKNYFTVPVGLNEAALSGSEVQIYPNPASRVISVFAANEAGVVNVRIVDMTGREQLTTTIEKEVNITNLSPGMYVMELTTRNGTVRKKFLKE